MSAYLIDTHVWLWMQSNLARLSPHVRDLVASPDNERIVSAATTWEIAIKHAAGKLALPSNPEHYLSERLRLSVTSVAPIELSHTVRAGSLPPHHRDPFDRMIVAQAQILGLPVITADPRIKQYDVEVIDA